jgi:hypothetical protein
MVQTCFTLVGSFSGYLWCSAVRVRLHERMHVHSRRGPASPPVTMITGDLHFVKDLFPTSID